MVIEVYACMLQLWSALWNIKKVPQELCSSCQRAFNLLIGRALQG